MIGKLFILVVLKRRFKRRSFTTLHPLQQSVHEYLNQTHPPLNDHRQSLLRPLNARYILEWHSKAQHEHDRHLDDPRLCNERQLT